VLDIDARGKPAEHEEKRQCEQPPVFDFHGRYAGSAA
jgi:hypothetical protein